MLIFIVLAVIFSEVQYVFMASEKEYGPYEVEFGNFEICHGPKVRDAANFSSALLNDQENYKIVINISFPGPVVLDEVRLMLFTTKDNKKKSLWNYNIKKPCQHFAVKAIIYQFLHNDKCTGKKEDVSVTLSLTDITYSFFGNNFFYGHYTYKATVTAKNGNLVCLSLTATFKKKK